MLFRSVITSYASGAVSGKGDNVGSLVGGNDERGTINTSYASGLVSRTEHVGGFAEENSGTINASYASGAALTEPVWENGEYLIYTSADLKIMANWANGSQASADAKYRLMEDIDLDGMDVPWLPIGASIDIPFNGEFNGGGHTVRNFVINRDVDYIGLFGIISGDAQISGLKVISFDIRGKNNVGGLVGLNSGAISASYANGSVSGNNCIGGLAGYNYIGTIITSYASGPARGTGHCIGGLVGQNYGTIITSYASGAVSGNQHIGGLVGYNEGTIGHRHPSGNQFVVGLVRYDNRGTINSSYASGEVIGYWSVGGLVGRNSRGTINTSYAIGAVSGTGRYVGGLVGYNNNGIISTSYTSGAVSGENEFVGGLIGENSKGTINLSYWLQDTPANINTGLKGIGVDDNVKNTNVTSLSLASMANRASFNADSWNFYGDPGVTTPDWCYTSFDNGAAPALLAFFDPKSAPDFNRINRGFIHIIPQSAELHAGEVKQLQFGTPGFKSLDVQGFYLSVPGLSGDKITIENPGMYKAVLSIDEHGIITVSADSTSFRNTSVENITISVDHKIGGYPQLQKSFSLFIIPDSTINRSDIR